MAVFQCGFFFVLTLYHWNQVYSMYLFNALFLFPVKVVLYISMYLSVQMHLLSSIILIWQLNKCYKIIVPLFTFKKYYLSKLFKLSNSIKYIPYANVTDNPAKKNSRLLKFMALNQEWKYSKVHLSTRKINVNIWKTSQVILKTFYNVMWYWWHFTYYYKKVSIIKQSYKCV